MDNLESQPYASSSIYSTIALAVVFIALTISIRFINNATDEPPYIYPSIPFVGHIVGMMQYGAKYFEIVNKDKKPIISLPVLHKTNYIISDANLAGLVQRNSKTLSFYSLIVEVTRRLIAFDKDAARICMYNINGEHGPGGLMSKVHEMMNLHLAPGPGLDSITAIQMERTGTMLNEQVPLNGKPIVTNLYAWQRHIFSICNAFAIYGPQNIFAMHPELEDEFWTFEEGMLGLVVDIFPSVTARKAYRARKKVLDGLIEYVKMDRHKKACPLIQERVQTNLAFGMSPEMAGHAELILMFGILGNAVPSMFWLTGNIFSRPELLDRIRKEVQSALDLGSPSDTPDSAKDVKVKISSKKINMTSCPLLYSCYREVLRDISLLTSARMVLEDTGLSRGAGQPEYVLREGSIVQIAGGVIHQDPRVWGKDAKSFNPERFLLKTLGPNNTSTQKAVHLPIGVPSPAFRAYGGGTVICPGRHFAQSELMTLAGVMALAFDITAPDGSTLKLPEKDDTRIPLSVIRPKFDPEVRIQRRKGWERARLNIGL